MKKFTVVLCIAGLLIMGTLYFKFASRGEAQSAHNYPADFKGALSRARADASSDRLGDLIRSAKRVTLSGIDLKSVVHVGVADDGTICVLDNQAGLVHLYSSNGLFIADLGKHGRKPGEYLMPTDCAVGPGKTFILSDFTDHHVTSYDANGRFQDSFIYTPQAFGAVRLLSKTGPAGEEFVLFGNTWTTDSSGKTVPARLSHFYTASGKFIRSDFDFPQKFTALNLQADSNVLVSQSQDGSIYFALPFGYEVYAISKDDRISPVLVGRQSPGFRAPKNPISLDAKHFSDYFSWELGCTPLVAVGSSGEYTFIEYQSFDPLRYTIDVWGTQTGRLVQTYHTNHLFLTSDHNGSLWFLENLDTREEKSYALIEGNISMGRGEGDSFAANRP